MQTNNLMPRLKEKYDKEIVSHFINDLNFSNQLAVPKIIKIVINSCSGKSVEDSKYLDYVIEVLGKITGQKALKTHAKKSVSSFKLREGMPIGAKVTLRGRRMYEFLDRLISVALPRVRDFRGTKTNAFDGHGNYSIGMEEVTVFPEASTEDNNFGLEININTSAKSDKDAYNLLKSFGLPIAEEEQK